MKSGRFRQVLMTFQTCFGWPLVVVDRWSLFRGRFSTIIVGRDLGWSLLTGGRYSEVVVNTGLTLLENFEKTTIIILWV
jgi:hypothetical protein